MSSDKLWIIPIVAAMLIPVMISVIAILTYSIVALWDWIDEKIERKSIDKSK